MRIVAGQYRGRILKSPDDNRIRPTSEKVRLALFNMLNSRGAVVDAVVLDAFCGTGAFALEALSQGAERAILIDMDKTSLELAKANTALLKESENCSFHLKDATRMPSRQDNEKPATLCFLDPPYRKKLLPAALKSLTENHWLAEGCRIVAEVEKEYSATDFQIEAEKIYGDTKIIIGRI